LDVKSIVLPVVVSDSLSDFIEPPLLLSDVVSPSLEVHCCIAVHLSNSIEWKLRDKIEWSVNVETKFFIKTLGFSLCFLIKIEYLPSLVGTVVSVVDLNFLAFNIFSLVYIKASVCILDVTEMLSLIDKDLPPT
jgi:hypothetical protein